jgi:uncharacterized protein (DUF362 family)
MNETLHRVRAVHCDYRSSEEEIYNALKRVTEPLSSSWHRIEKAKRVVIKFNMNKPPEWITYFEGRRRELVDDAVCRAVLRLLKQRTSAELVATDTNTYADDHLMDKDFNYAHILKEFGVRFVDSNLPPFKLYEVPDGGGIFERYYLSECLEGSEIVSISKMKNHVYAGITLCMKNLFGLPPISPPIGRSRSYFHHLIRLPYVLADLGRIADPCLNVVDALTGQWGREWGGEGRICNALIAGDQLTATDACSAYLMGHDPASDWPSSPFRRDRNHLLVAAERGFGTVELKEIDFESEVSSPLAEFDSVELDPPRTVSSWRRTACEQALYYRENRSQLVDRYNGKFIFLQDGEVVWHGTDPSHLVSRRILSGKKKDRAVWLKLVDPEEREGEQFSVYERTLHAISSQRPTQDRSVSRKSGH